MDSAGQALAVRIRLLARERDEAVKRAETIECIHDGFAKCGHFLDVLRAENTRLRERLAVAEEDTARLDWLDVQGTDAIGQGDQLKWGIGLDTIWEADDLRDAIDRARKS
jgi:hypothetical protein